MNVTQRMYLELDKRNFSVSSLCRHLGLKTSVVAGWKRQESIPPAKYLVLICDFLNVSVDYLLTGKEREVKNTVTDEEYFIISQYRELSEQGKQLLKDTLNAYALVYKKRNNDSVVVNTIQAG